MFTPTPNEPDRNPWTAKGFPSDWIELPLHATWVQWAMCDDDQAGPSCGKLGQAGPSWAKLCQRPGWAKLWQGPNGPGWTRLGQAVYKTRLG